MDKLFNRFRRKLMIEAIAKSFLIGALIGACLDSIYVKMVTEFYCRRASNT